MYTVVTFQVQRVNPIQTVADKSVTITMTSFLTLSIDFKFSQQKIVEVGSVSIKRYKDSYLLRPCRKGQSQSSEMFGKPKKIGHSSK